MSTEPDMENVLKDLLKIQKFMVLAMLRKAYPYTCLVAFAATDDLKHLIFATNRETHKYKDLVKDSRVSVLVDNNTNRAKDIRQSMAVTALGEAKETYEAERMQLLKCYLRKQPHMEKFACAPNTALFKITVSKYFIVSDFQKVQEYIPAQ